LGKTPNPPEYSTQPHKQGNETGSGRFDFSPSRSSIDQASQVTAQPVEKLFAELDKRGEGEVQYGVTISKWEEHTVSSLSAKAPIRSSIFLVENK